MSRRTVWIPVVAASTALAGCTTIPVRIDQNAQLLATVHCQSVGWAGGFKGDSPLRSTIANPLNEARLRDAIAANLQIARIPLVDTPAARVPAAAGEPGGPLPDRLRHRHGAPDRQRVPGGLGLWRGLLGSGLGSRLGIWLGIWLGSPVCLSPELHHPGSVRLRPPGKPMWHASAEQDLNGLTGDAAIQRIRAAVDAIFLKFPR